MTTRRKFIAGSFFSAFGLFTGAALHADSPNRLSLGKGRPTVLSTWNNLEANKTAWAAIESGKSALDAVEAGVRIVEADPRDMSVGYGGRPDREGNVTLDACIMDEKGNCGSVCYLQHIMHPISVARLVMEKTPHVMLAGEGALQFALAQGFERQNLLTPAAKKAWEEWKEKSEYEPVINIENHDTIGMLAIDQAGKLSGACTTSGAAFKLPGRVGDSPIIGAGLYVDNEVGGAVATGLGEAVIKTVGSFLIVELMRQGKSPMEACKEAVRRIAAKQPGHKRFQVGFLALNRLGEVGAYGIQPGFTYALYQRGKNRKYDADALLKPSK